MLLIISLLAYSANVKLKPANVAGLHDHFNRGRLPIETFSSLSKEINSLFT